MVSKQSLEEQVRLLREKLDDMEQRVVPRGICVTCGWFQLRKKPPRNRGCRYPGEIKLEKGKCVWWQRADDLWKRQPRNITV